MKIHSSCGRESRHRETNGAGKLLTQAAGLLSGKPFFLSLKKKKEKKKSLGNHQLLQLQRAGGAESGPLPLGKEKGRVPTSRLLLIPAVVFLSYALGLRFILVCLF